MSEEINDDELVPEIVEVMKKHSVDMMKFAYCPYSTFQVGASLLTSNGGMYGGCNVENAVYGSTICAERVAICKAISEGHKSFRAIAVATNVKDGFATPCGSCRQFLAEFGLDCTVYLVNSSTMLHETRTVGSLLPGAFTPEVLVKGMAEDKSAKEAAGGD